jgi:hypothetical protein
MKRRTIAKRRNRMHKADRAVEKIQIALMKRGLTADAGLNTPAGKRAMRKLEHAIDRLPPHRLLHKW